MSNTTVRPFMRAQVSREARKGTDGAQEAEETEGTGKWEMSSEYSHGLN